MAATIGQSCRHHAFVAWRLDTADFSDTPTRNLTNPTTR